MKHPEKERVTVVTRDPDRTRETIKDKKVGPQPDTVRKFPLLSAAVKKSSVGSGRTTPMTSR